MDTRTRNPELVPFGTKVFVYHHIVKQVDTAIPIEVGKGVPAIEVRIKHHIVEQIDKTISIGIAIGKCQVYAACDVQICGLHCEKMRTTHPDIIRRLKITGQCKLTISIGSYPE